GSRNVATSSEKVSPIGKPHRQRGATRAESRSSSRRTPAGAVQANILFRRIEGHYGSLGRCRIGLRCPLVGRTDPKGVGDEFLDAQSTSFRRSPIAHEPYLVRVRDERAGSER